MAWTTWVYSIMILEIRSLKFILQGKLIPSGGPRGEFVPCLCQKLHWNPLAQSHITPALHLSSLHLYSPLAFLCHSDQCLLVTFRAHQVIWNIVPPLPDPYLVYSVKSFCQVKEQFQVLLGIKKRISLGRLLFSPSSMTFILFEQCGPACNIF